MIINKQSDINMLIQNEPSNGKNVFSTVISQQLYFQLLHNKFEILIRLFFYLQYNRSGQGCQCNQAIMLITDGPPSRNTEIFKTYNFPHSPVRFFTYLIGKDTNSVSEMHWMACNHKGKYL